MCNLSPQALIEVDVCFWDGQIGEAWGNNEVGYVGFNIDGVWSDPQRFYPNLPDVGIPPTTFTSNNNDTIYGAHGGFQWQLGQWVFGVVASL